jgi:RNA polymerase sigma-70 factor (ECF subfamily)
MQAGVTIRIGDEAYGMSAADLRRLSGEELIAYVQAGHQDAFAVLFERYHRLVLRIALKILRNAAEAEDLMQSVFFEIFRAVAQFDPARGSIKTWIAQYAYHRSLGRRQYLSVRAVLSAEEIDEFVKRQGSASAHRPTAGMSEQEMKRFIEQALANLNEPQRESLRLAFFEGLSMA